MSLKRIFKALLSFGLSQTEAKVYIYLIYGGPSKARDISGALKMSRQQLYRNLKKLRSRRIVKCSGFPALFYAEPVEEVFVMLMKEKNEQAQLTDEKKANLLSIWESFNIKENNDNRR